MSDLLLAPPFETREEQIARIQANLQLPQTNHHPTCCCSAHERIAQPRREA